MKLLHVPEGLPVWGICSNINYNGNFSSYHLYPKLMKAGLRIWKFSGDVKTFPIFFREMQSSPSLVHSIGLNLSKRSKVYNLLKLRPKDHCELETLVRWWNLWQHKTKCWKLLQIGWTHLRLSERSWSYGPYWLEIISPSALWELHQEYRFTFILIIMWKMI